jgi:hypothetical protein
MILDHLPNSVVIIHEQDGRHGGSSRAKGLDIRIALAKSQLREHETGFDHSFEPPLRHRRQIRP